MVRSRNNCHDRSAQRARRAVVFESSETLGEGLRCLRGRRRTVSYRFTRSCTFRLYDCARAADAHIELDGELQSAAAPVRSRAVSAARARSAAVSNAPRLLRPLDRDVPAGTGPAAWRFPGRQPESLQRANGKRDR
jgi:hypothetical protein